MLSVALTGNVGSGKSTVARHWSKAGVPVVSADELSREAVLPGSEGLAAISRTFGDGVLTAEGTLDRERLGALVFSDEEARETLEGILHPIIWRSREVWLEAQRVAGASLVVSEIPLLFETGHESDFDLVVFVDAPEAARLERIVRNRGIDERAAQRVMAAQMDPALKRAAAHVVIDNDQTLDHLEHEAGHVLEDLRARAGQGTLRVDLHLHTHGSWDCLSDPEAVLERALSLGYGRIAITDHDRMEVALQMVEKHPEQVIPGEEVRTGEGIDVIGLYLSEEIPKGTSAAETIERIRDQGGIPYLPHPYAGGKGGGGRLADVLGPLCDVVEVFNARLHSPEMNRQAEGLATRHGKLRGAGSDAHTVGEIGNAFVEVKPHANRADALLDALAGPSRYGGSEASRLVHLASSWAKVRKKLPAAAPTRPRGARGP